MDKTKALEIVSYKLGLKRGIEILEEDPVLLEEVVKQAVSDKENDDQKSIGLRQYMEATKVVNELREFHERDEGAAWLKKVGQEADITTTESGLSYRVLKEGVGQPCSAGATVKVHYEGKLRNGEVFDSSYDSGKPATFPVNGVIQGWQEGLQLMTVGSTYEFYIPEELAYGERGAGSDIPPYSALFFQVELLAAL